MHVGSDKVHVGDVVTVDVVLLPASSERSTICLLPAAIGVNCSMA